MKRTIGGAVAVGATAGALGAARVVRSLTGASDGKSDHWHVVTVNRPVDGVMRDGTPPGPLADLGDAVEVRAVPAPGDRGTELAARLRDGATLPAPISGAARLTGDDPRQRVRAALRESKQLLETGEVLCPDDLETARRTLLNMPLELATRLARGEGLL
jgi:hypothetical protein